jgi:hypothetical protein
MKYRKLNQNEKDKLVGTACFLNGKHAYLYGRRKQFATVAEINGPLAVEWAWETAHRIMNNNQKFST